MRIQTALITALVLAFAAISLGKEKENGAPIKFAFAPPDGATYVRNTKRSRTVIIDRQKKTESYEDSTRYLFKKTAAGYDVTVTTVTAKVKVNGKPGTDPFLQAASNMPFTFKVSRTGEFLSIAELNKVVKAVMASVPAGADAETKKLIDKNFVLREASNAWISGAGRLPGSTARIGQSWRVKNRFFLLTGDSLELVSDFKLSDAVACGDKQCVKVKMSYSTDPATASRVIAAGLEKQLNAKGGNRVVNVSNFVLKGSGEFIMEPATGLMHAVDEQRTIQWTAEAAGQGKGRFGVTESLKSRFDYDQ